MRIIAGALKGRRIRLPAGIKARPTTDFAKEALFNILEDRLELEGAVVYDLFSGTGSITFEFISRGAAMVYSVDISPISQDLVRKTAREFGVEGRVKMIRADAWRLAKNLEAQADIVFADPPFTLQDYHKLHQLVFENKFLKPGGLLIIEHPSKADFSKLAGFEFSKKYGTIHFSFFSNSLSEKNV